MTIKKFARHQKVASRYLLPLEMYLGVITIAWGISGGISKGSLFYALAEYGNNLSWMISFCLIGFYQVAVAAYEWRCGRKWVSWTCCTFRHPSIYRSVGMRSAGSFLTAVIWVYVMSSMVDEGTRAVGALWITAPSTFLFAIWSIWENTKVRVALDPNYETTKTLSFYR